MSWRAAKSLLRLREQVNQKFPNRDKSWDGLIGDERHSSRTSDHNPNSDGVVCAIDITHDPRGGVDSYKLAEQLRQSRDPRIKYIISNRKIASSTTNPWKWRKYTGSNPHDHHVHISVNSQKRYYDDDSPWEIPMLGKVPSEAVEVSEAEEGDDERSVSSAGLMSSVESIADAADSVTTISAKAKPLFKSRISVAAATMGAGNVVVAATQAPPTLWEQFISIWKSPVWWLVVINVCLTGYIIYHYWSDHGFGALKRDRNV